MRQLVILFFSFIAISTSAQTFGTGGLPYSYICDASSGSGTISFYVGTGGSGITYTVKNGNTIIASGSGGSNFSFSQSFPVTVGDQIYVDVYGSSHISASTTVKQLFTPTAPTLSSDVTTICGGNHATLTGTSYTTPSGTFNWSIGATSISSTEATVSTSGSYSITESNSCGTSPASNVIVITASNTPSAPTASATSTTLCDGASATLTASGTGGTYTWSNGATGATTSVSTAGSYYVTETNSCGTSPASNSISITTLTTPTVAAITGTTTVCPSSTSQLSDATSGGIWSTLDATKVTINSTGLVTGVASGSATIKYSVSNICGTGFAQTIITVNSGTPSAPTITSPKTLLCNGESITITSTNPTSGGTIIWSNGDNGTTISVSTSASFKAYELNSCGQSPYSNIITTTTLSNPSVASITGNSSVCVGSQTTFANVTGGGAWSTSNTSIATVNTSGVVTGINGSNSAVIQYAVTNSCGTTTVSKTITVNALPVLTSITGQSNICTNNVYSYTNTQSGGVWSISNASVSSVNTSGQVTTTSFGTSTLTYTYTDANTCTSAVTKNLTINALPIVNISSAIVGSNVELSGTGASIYTWSSGETTAVVDKVLNISNIYTVTGTDGNGCTASKSFTVDAAPNASSTAITSSLGTIFCTGSNTDLTLSAGNGYYWDSGENTRTITTPNIGTHTGYVLYSVNYKVEAANIILTNYPVPTVTAINDTNSLAYCNGTVVASLTLTGSVAGSTFSWTSNNTSIGVLQNGTNTIPSFTASNTTNLPVSSSFTVVPKANGCVGTTYTFTTTVNPTPNLLTDKNFAICNKASNPITLTSNVATATYLWTRLVNTNLSNATISATTSTIDEILENTIRDNTTANYSVVTSAYGCSTTNTINVIVHPTVSADQLATLSYCNGTQPGILTFTGWANGSTYSWTSDNTSVGVPASGTNTIPNYVATNLGGDAVQANLAVIPTANGCTGTTMKFKIIVNPTPNLLTDKNFAICNKASNPIALTSNVNYATFFWTRNATANIKNASYSSTTAIIDEQLNNIISDDAIALYTVVTTANNCSTTKTISVLVHPSVTVDSVSSFVFCNGATAPLQTFKGLANNSTFYWTNDNTDIGVLSSGTNTISSFTATNNSDIPIVANFSVEPRANGCIGLQRTFKITVNPTPNLLTDKTFNICDGRYLQYIPKVNVKSNYSILWAVKKEDSVTIDGSISSGTIFNKLHNSSQLIKNIQLGATINSLGCLKYDTLNVSVIPNPFGSLIASKNNITSGSIDTFQFITTDTISRINTWNLGFGMPSFSSISDSYAMNFYHNTDTTNTIKIFVLNRYGCSSTFSKTISIIGVPVLIPRYDSIPTKLQDNEVWQNTLLPVPYNDYLSFRYHLDQDESASFNFYDTEGFPVYSTEVKLIKGNNQIRIPEIWRLKKDKVYMFICNSPSIHHQQLFYGVSYNVSF